MKRFIFPLQVVDFILVHICMIVATFSMFAFSDLESKAPMGLFDSLNLFVWVTIPIVVNVSLILSILSKPEKFKQVFYLSLFPVLYTLFFATINLFGFIFRYR